MKVSVCLVKQYVEHCTCHLRLVLPLRLASSANICEHWTKLAKRRQTHRRLAMALVRSHRQWVDPNMFPAFVVTISRIAPKALDDDNLAYAAKGLRDGVADALGIDDGDTRRVRWLYEQRKPETPRTYGVEIRVDAVREPFAT